MSDPVMGPCGSPLGRRMLDEAPSKAEVLGLGVSVIPMRRGRGR